MRKLILLFIIIFYRLAAPAQEKPLPDKFQLTLSHCASYCCLFEKIYTFLPDSTFIYKEGISNIDYHTFTGTWKEVSAGILLLVTTDYYGGECAGEKRPTGEGCGEYYTCDKYKAVHEEISDTSELHVYALHGSADVFIDSLDIEELDTTHFITGIPLPVRLRKDELKGLSKEELGIRRNEIFARYGYIFNNPDLQEYFESKDWYEPRYIEVDAFFTETDRANLKLIMELENKR